MIVLSLSAVVTTLSIVGPTLVSIAIIIPSSAFRLNGILIIFLCFFENPIDNSKTAWYNSCVIDTTTFLGGGENMTYAKLRGAIRERYGAEGILAAKLGMNPVTLSKKLNGKSDWTKMQIEKTLEALSIPKREVYDYFFA